MYNITFQQIEAFLAVARFLNISKAAQSLYVSQPSLSKTLRRFENCIGFEVLKRSNQGITLTPQGEYLRGALDVLCDNMNRVIKTAYDLAGEQSKVLRLVVPSSFDAVEDYNTLKGFIRDYESKYPQVELNIHLCEFREMRQHFELGETDVAIAHSFSISGLSGAKHRSISEYSLHLAMSAQHPLAAYDTIQPDMLNASTVYAVTMTASEQDTIQRITHRCKTLGFTPKKIILLDNFMTLLYLLREMRGVSICGKFNIITADDIKYYPLKSATPKQYVVAVWREDRLTTEARNFIEMLPEYNEHTVAAPSP